MSTQSLITSAGLIVTRDAIDIQHVRLAPGVPARLGRFAAFIKQALVADAATPGALAARLVALDGICPTSLTLLEDGLRQPYVWRDMTLVEWREETPPRTERRALNPSTLTAVRCRASADGGLLGELRGYLERCKLYSGFRAKDRVHELERDALCWWYQCLPMALFFHVSGLQPLSAVSRLCLAREQAKKVPRTTLPQHLHDNVADTESCSEVLDIAAISEGSDECETVLLQALDRMTSAEKEPNAAALRRWVVELLGLRFRAMQAGPINSLLLAWGVDMCESGTIRSESPSKETPRAYFGKASTALLPRLRKLPHGISDWNIDLLDPLYRELIAEQLKLNPGGSSARSLASALTNFHAFLVEWYEVEPLRLRLHTAVPLVEVRANVVWDHELDLAFSWIHLCTDDRRLNTALRVVMCIAKEAPARSSELSFLRIRNIQQYDGWVEVEVAPSLRYGRLKTRAAQRRLRITDPYAMSLLMGWKRERQVEGAKDDGLLFADPVDARLVYRRHTMSTLVTALLRAATGDPRTVGHDLRHTVLSRENGTALASSTISSINRQADHATTAGHVTSATSLTHYTHLYEEALRQRLDASLVTIVGITSGEAAGLAGLSAVNLRQRASRNGSSTDSYAWMLLLSAQDHIALPRAAEPWTWVDADPPPTRRAGGIEPTVAITRLLLAALANRNADGDVTAHFLLPQADVEALSRAAMSITHDVTRYTWPEKYNVRVALPIGLEESLRKADVDLGDVTSEKFNKLYQWFTAKQDMGLLSAAHESWKGCRIGEYLALDVPTRALALLRLLAQAGVDPRALRVCYRASDEGQPTDPQALSAAERDFAVAFGMRPRTWAARPREWCAAVYLQWDSPDCIEAPHASSGSLRGLDAWMLVVGAHVKHWNQKGEVHHAESH